MTSTSPKSPKSALTTVTGALCFILTVGGAGGLLYEWLGWIRFMGFLRFLAPDGYEIYGYIVVIALGLAVGVAGDTLTRRDRA
ncbi:hypothetical protein ACFV30_00700 [Streptomyces sp. NPDC059752]|uniref:hypothetical protein n=1 Tax=unclassified Streptomyces TaxID=2593676 RepID=UPI00365A0B00